MSRELQRSLVLLAAGALAFYLYGQCSYNRGRADERTLRQVAATDSSAHVTDSLLRVMRNTTEKSNTEIARLGRETDYYRREVLRLKSAPKTGAIVPDSGTAVHNDGTVGDTAASLNKAPVLIRDSIIAHQDSIIVYQDSTISLWRALAYQRDTLLQRSMAERDSYRSLTVALRKQAHPGILESARRALPWAAGAVLVWEIAR